MRRSSDSRADCPKPWSPASAEVRTRSACSADSSATDRSGSVGVEAAGEGILSGHHGASLSQGKPGVLHGSLSYLLQDEDGQVAEAHSISAGLDYPGVGPEHSHLRDAGRVRYESATDREALEAFMALSQTEGIIPALESAHALAFLAREGAVLGADGPVVVCLSGRGDKDVEQAGAALGIDG